jgi:BirA family biotin operon repressor/biotin-[acetyl-CoA-carboxylase] ligase
MWIYRCGSALNVMNSQLDFPGFTRAERHASVTSTMDAARTLLSNNPPMDTAWSAVVTADEQTAGRGRQGRVWLASHGSLMATYIFATDLPVAALAGYSLTVGVAVAEVLEHRGVQTALKWPNDIVVVDGVRSLRKVGGILIEVQEAAGFQCILIGLGINIAPAPIEVRDIAVSVQELGGKDVSAEELLVPIGFSLRLWHQRFIEGGFKAIRSAWSGRACFLAGQSELTLDLGEGRVLAGRFVGVDEGGALVIEASGKQHQILSGHVTSFNLSPEDAR